MSAPSAPLGSRPPSSANESRTDSTVDGSSATLFLPHLRSVPDSRAGWTLSPELRRQITRRLRVIGITYSLAYFFADVVPDVVFGQIGRIFHNPWDWIPTYASILAGLAVSWFASSSRWSWQAKLNVGLVFEIGASYGIALAQYQYDPLLRIEPHVLHVLSPSWVAVWMLFYSIVVPAPPRKTLLALIGSASAPIVTIGLLIHQHGLAQYMPLSMFLMRHVLPYAICVGMSYGGARIVYNLGTDVARAQELGSYRLIERLGRGGMGEVWRASHQLLARPAAIKFIRPDAIAGVGSDEGRLLLKRFELEARATASLTSAHTIDLYDFGVGDDGSFYYVMELLDGLDCDALVRRFGPLPPARAVHLLVQVCESLDEAHTKGLIHRDVKPANIYVCRSGNRFDFVKVLDFGLVAHRHAPESNDLRITRPHQAVGTPQFMPPEIALGAPIDGRTDLYALGCVAFWMLTGRPVFPGDNLFDVISKHLHGAPDPPSRHAPYRVPPELDAVILDCLEKEPDRRPPTARALARRLRDVPFAERWSDEQAETWWGEARHSAPDGVSTS